MPSPKSNNRRGSDEKNRRGKITDKASSFHYSQSATSSITSSQLRRPKTVPDLLPSRGLFETTSFQYSQSATSSASSELRRPKTVPDLGLVETTSKLTKLLMNVSVQGSVGAVQLVISPESSVGELISAALSQYVKEARRPILTLTEASIFNLHYSQFSLECLDREEKLMNLGSRNFFMCPKKSTNEVETTSSSSSSCATQADQLVTKSAFSWLKFMDFML